MRIHFTQIQITHSSFNTYIQGVSTSMVSSSMNSTSTLVLKFALVESFISNIALMEFSLCTTNDKAVLIHIVQFFPRPKIQLGGDPLHYEIQVKQKYEIRVINMVIRNSVNTISFPEPKVALTKKLV